MTKPNLFLNTQNLIIEEEIKKLHERQTEFELIQNKSLIETREKIKVLSDEVFNIKELLNKIIEQSNIK